MYFCHNCGTQLREDARFCHNCGAEQIVEQAPKPPVLEWSKAHPEDKAAKPPVSVSPPSPRESRKLSWEELRPEPAAPPAPVKEERPAPATTPAPAPAPVPAPAAPPEPLKPEAPQVQIPLPTGSYTWKNVKISGEFKNGVGSITITFS